MLKEGKRLMPQIYDMTEEEESYEKALEANAEKHERSGDGQTSQAPLAQVYNQFMADHAVDMS